MQALIVVARFNVEPPAVRGERRLGVVGLVGQEVAEGGGGEGPGLPAGRGGGRRRRRLGERLVADEREDHESERSRDTHEGHRTHPLGDLERLDVVAGLGFERPALIHEYCHATERIW